MTSKLAPRVWAGIVSFIFLLIASVLMLLVTNFQLDQKNAAVVKNLAYEFSQLQTPTQAIVKSIATKNNLSYLTISDGNQLSLTEGADGQDIVGSLLPSSSKSTYIIEGTNYQAAFNIDPSCYTTFTYGMFVLLFLTIFSSTYIVGIIGNKSLRTANDAVRNAVAEKKFDDIEDPALKKDMQDVFTQMTSEITDLKKENDHLKVLVDQDSLTGISNRKKFRFDLSSILSNTEDASISLLAIVRATELTSINQTRGFARGDQYLQDVAKIVSDVVKKFSSTITVGSKKKPEVYRLSGSDFSIIVPNANDTIAAQLVKELKSAFDQYTIEKDIESTAYTGVTLIKPGQTEEIVLARADRALSEAQTSSVNSGFIKSDADDDFLQGESHWAGIIQNIIDRRSIVLQQQPIISLSFNARCYNEIFTRFVNEEGQSYPTETVFAMAQRHDMLSKLEQTVIESILLRYNKNNLTNQRWGINLSINALLSTTFVIWLERQMLKHSDICSNIVFEISENILECNVAASIRLFDMLRRVNVKSCICKFGNGLGSFRLYRELKPDYIKLDPSLVDTLERDHTSQIFVRTIVEVSHRLGCTVIAEGVEEYSQKQLLESMYIDAVQGYLVAKPGPLNDGDVGTDPVSNNNAQGVGNDNSDTMY